MRRAYFRKTDVIRVTKILVVAERASASQVALQKAVLIARHFNATIELFTCDAEHAFALGGDMETEAIVARCLEESRRFLDALRGSISARDLQVSIAVACASTVGEGICEHVRKTAPSLVIKSFTDAGVAPAPLPSVTDLHLIRACPVPLLLTRGRSWHPVPRVCAAVDLARADQLGHAADLLTAAEYLAEGFHGELELVYSDRAGTDGAATRALDRLAREAQISAARIDVLAGPPETALARRVVDRNIDVLALGAPGVQDAAAIGRTLTEGLLESVACDVLLVPPTMMSVRELSGAARVVANSVHGQQ